MQVFLIRHTTPQILKGICYGQSDIPLANTFEEEKIKVLEKIPTDIDAVYTSPLTRCVNLAASIVRREELAERDFKIKRNHSLHQREHSELFYEEVALSRVHPKIAYHSDSRLLELNFGAWELKNWNDLPQDTLTDWMNDYVNVSVPEGESFRDLAKRTQGFVEELVTTQYQRVAVVTHAGVIRSILCHYLQKPLEKAFEISVEYGEVKKLVF